MASLESATVSSLCVQQPSLSDLLQGRKCNEWPILSESEEYAKLGELPLWTIQTTDMSRLYRKAIMKNFSEALKFINQAGALAEELNHHPGKYCTLHVCYVHTSLSLYCCYCIIIIDFHLTGWNTVEVVIYTHSLGGLTELDFILAGVIDSRIDVQYSKKRTS